MGFIRSETVKFIHAAPENGHEDELSIAMLAFYEAVLAYEKSRGAFLPYGRPGPSKTGSSTTTGRRKRHGNVISLHTPLGGEEDGRRAAGHPSPTPWTMPGTMWCAPPAGGRSRRVFREAGPVRPDLFRRGGQLPPAGADLRRLAAGCWTSLGPSRSLLKRVEDTGKLPMGELAAGSGTDKKTMERHRKYLVAIPAWPLTNGYEIIRGHLCQVGPKRGGDEA